MKLASIKTPSYNDPILKQKNLHDILNHICLTIFKHFESNPPTFDIQRLRDSFNEFNGENFDDCSSAGKVSDLNEKMVELSGISMILFENEFLIENDITHKIRCVIVYDMLILCLKTPNQAIDKKSIE